MIVSYPVAFVVLESAALSDGIRTQGAGTVLRVSLMSGSLEPRTWGGCGYSDTCGCILKRLSTHSARAIPTRSASSAIASTRLRARGVCALCSRSDA